MFLFLMFLRTHVSPKFLRTFRTSALIFLIWTVGTCMAEFKLVNNNIELLVEKSETL